jgi:cobalt-zinc-cadmium resistance protein CzcA
MVCAFIPLFTMHGAEGELFGPMAQTYAFALGCALFLALTLTPVLCMFFFKEIKPVPDNILVRGVKTLYLAGLRVCLAYPRVMLGAMVGMLVLTIAWPLMGLGREFMPELEEGNLWIRAVFPVNTSLEATRDSARMAREIISGERFKITDDTLQALRSEGVGEDELTPLAGLKGREETRTTLANLLAEALPSGTPKRVSNLVFKNACYNVYPEIKAVIVQSGRPDDGTDPGSLNNVEIFVPLKAEKDWPYIQRPNGRTMVRTHHDVTDDMRNELSRKLPGIEWAFSQYIHDNVMEAISGVKGDNCVKIYGPDLDRLEELAERTKTELTGVKGLYGVGVFHIMGQSNLEFVVDKEKCKRWGVQVADVNNVINTAVHGAAQTQMVEGEKTFDITLRYPFVKRQDEASILDLPVDIENNTVTAGSIPTSGATPFSGPASGVSPTGRSDAAPAQGSVNVPTYSNALPRLRLRDLVSPTDAHGNPDPKGSFTRPGGSMIMRELGKRFIAVKYSIRDDWDLASAVAEVKKKTQQILPEEGPYRAEFGGEFEQMEAAERRLLTFVPVSLVLILVLLYVAFKSMLDAVVVLSNVLALAAGGIWTLYLTGTNFSISAAVGFVSLFGVAIMDGLLTISFFNDLRRQGMPVRDAITQGALLRVRPATMTALTAILGLLPAALSTAIGSQTQRPLAFVVVGGMTATLLVTHYLMPLLYTFYGHREPPAASSLSH